MKMHFGNTALSTQVRSYDHAVQIAYSIEATMKQADQLQNKCPLHPRSNHTMANCRKLQNSQPNNGNNRHNNSNSQRNGNSNHANGGTSNSNNNSNSNSNGNPSPKCFRCGAPYHKGHRCKTQQSAPAVNASQTQPAPSTTPSTTTNTTQGQSNSGNSGQPSTNAIQANTYQDFVDAVRELSGFHGDINSSTLDINTNAIAKEEHDDTAINTSSSYAPTEPPPPFTAPILLNGHKTIAFIDPGASHSFISPAVVTKYITPYTRKNHKTTIINGPLSVTLGNNSAIKVSQHVLHVRIHCGTRRLHHDFFVMELSNSFEVLFGRDINTRIGIGMFGIPV